MIAIVATYRAAPGQADTVAGFLGRMVDPSSAEPGCRAYLAHRSPDDPAEFLLYEQYTDRQALEAHRGSAHFVELVQGEIVPRLESRTVAVYDVLASSSA